MAMRLSAYELEPAPESLFERGGLERPCVDRRPGRRDVDIAGPQVNLVVGNELPYRLTRREALTLRRADIPTLTITSDPYNSIAVVAGTGPDWVISFCAAGDGATEAEARDRLQQISMRVSGGTVSLVTPGLYDGLNRSGDLRVEGPADAGVVIHASYSFVEVRDMAGPVRVAATHARARILDTTGQVDVSAACIDFAAACGRVTLSAEAEINLKMRAGRFDGTLLAWAQRSVRMVVPAGFTTSTEAVVSHRKRFVCRADLPSGMKLERQGELSIYTNGAEGSPGQPGANLHLRSEASTVVNDGEKLRPTPAGPER